MNNNLVIFSLELLLAIIYLVFGIVRIVNGFKTKNMKLMIFDFSKKKGTLLGTSKEKVKFYLNLVANLLIVFALMNFCYLLLQIMFA